MFVKFEDQSPAQYPGFQKRALYVEGYDGTRLALDYLRPVKEDGNVEERPLPVVMLASRGGRFSMDRPNYPANYFNGNGPLALYLIARGYVYVAVEMRGCGASFGVNDSFASHENRLDVEAVIRWIVAQPWCDGNVGMMGGSNRSFIQVCTAGDVAPEGLKAISPCVSNINFYYSNFPNGVSRIPAKMLSGFSSPYMLSKEERLKSVVPVDDDPEGDLAYQAYTQDQYPNNINFMGNLIRENMCRDTVDPKTGRQPNLELAAIQFTDHFLSSGIKQHQFGGWFDMSAGSQIAACNVWGGSMIIGPWSHQGTEHGSYRPEKYPDETINVGELHKRWFDYALKGIDNGWDKQPKFFYYTIGAPAGFHWRWSDQFPLKETQYTKLFLSSGPSGTIDARYDGTLQRNPAAQAKANYRVDLDIKFFEEVNGETYNTYAREWDGDMSPMDRKCITFTSCPLTQDMPNEMTGYPLVELWVSSTHPDGDFIAVLEEVHSDGKVNYITDGVIRASHREIAPSPLYDSVGIPFHPSMEEDVRKNREAGLKDPVLLKFSMEPISYCFQPGSRIRLSIFCAETTTYQHPMYDPADLPEITIYMGAEKMSHITLPMIPSREPQFAWPEQK